MFAKVCCLSARRNLTTACPRPRVAQPSSARAVLDAFRVRRGLSAPVGGELSRERRGQENCATAARRLGFFKTPTLLMPDEGTPYLRRAARHVNVRPSQREVLLRPHPGQQRELEDYAVRHPRSRLEEIRRLVRRQDAPLHVLHFRQFDRLWPLLQVIEDGGYERARPSFSSRW